MDKTLLLIRHPEATKNVRDSFASDHGGEELTETGSSQVASLCTELDALSTRYRHSRILVVGANSKRSIPCATALGNTLEAPMRLDARLTSIRGGNIAGLTEQAVASALPEYFQGLELYRRGIVSSYDLPHPGEDLRQFEARIAEAMVDIEHENAELILACAHKSAITAALIRYARMFHDYPTNFFGFVELPLASVSIVQIAGSDGRVRGVGVPAGSVASYVC